MWIAVCAENFEHASHLALAFSDDLRLVVEDLGWGETAPAESIDLKLPPDVLRRVFERMRNQALGLRTSEEKERVELLESWRQNQVVLDTCEQVLAGLDATHA